MTSSLAESLAEWVGNHKTVGILTDFDGTLAPIVDDPAQARPLDGADEMLAGLAEKFAIVGVISGRPAAYLAEWLPRARGVVLAGLYGLERVVDGGVVESPVVARWKPVVAGVADEALAEAPVGVSVEPKGSTVTLHVRRAPELLSWVERFAAGAAARSGLVAHGGRMSVELRPPEGGDKGSVVAELSAGLDAVSFFGDDRGDLPAFGALRELRAGGVRTLAVAVGSAESPAELLVEADLVVKSPSEVMIGLSSLL